MHDLLYSLQDHDIGYLKIISELWGFDLPAETTLVAAEWLATAMLDEANLEEMLESLPDLARPPWETLQDQGGRSAYADMVRTFGPIREMGTGKRDREKPWRDPISGLEILWYRGLIARAFVETTTGFQEFLYIPSNIYQQLSRTETTIGWIPGRETDAPNHQKTTSQYLIHDVTTILAALRKNPLKMVQMRFVHRTELDPFLHQPQSQELIIALLQEMAILQVSPLQPNSEATRQLFEEGEVHIVARLLRAWKDSKSWNDLQFVEGIKVQSDAWPNNPSISRLAFLDILQLVPVNIWWDMESFIQSIQNNKPSFLRPAGDFDSWYIQDAKTDQFLRGYEYWHRIEGALIRYLLTQPLHILGAIDLGSVHPGQPFTTFRLRTVSRTLFEEEFPTLDQEEPSTIQVFPDGRILAPLTCTPSNRYQIARFCDWIDVSAKGYGYRITPSALQRAFDQDLRLKQIRTVFETAQQDSLHPTLESALSRWAERGREAYVEKALLLRLKDHQALEILQSNPSTSRYLHEILGPTCVSVRKRDLEKLYSAASKLGILIDILEDA